MPIDLQKAKAKFLDLQLIDHRAQYHIIHGDCSFVQYYIMFPNILYNESSGLKS